MGVVQRLSGRNGGCGRVSSAALETADAAVSSAAVETADAAVSVVLRQKCDCGENEVDMLRVYQVKIRIPHSKERLKKKLSDVLRVPEQEILEIKPVRQAIDARKKPELFYTYTLDVAVKNEEKILCRFRVKENQVSLVQESPYIFPHSEKNGKKSHVVIVGMGPAGLFCGYFLALHGYSPILLERGKSVEERQKDVELFWETGELKPDSNVQFGEGGAGTFSDGKLNTLVKDKDGRNRVVLETLVKFGAKESICYEAKPHIGTDVLSRVVSEMRKEIIRLGGQVRFASHVTEILTKNGCVCGVKINDKEELSCERVVLAIGHSARDTFAMLYDKKVPMEPKAFAVGLRVEHPQSMINEAMYGAEYPEEIGAAPYKVVAQARNGRSVYSFCMCPGGDVVNASSEEGYTAVNGMSYSGRDGKNANSAIVVAVTPEDFGADHPLSGIAFQRELEKKAYELGMGKIPAQRYGDFKSQVMQTLKDRGGVVQAEAFGQSDAPASMESAADAEAEAVLEPACKGHYVWADVSRILPQPCNEAFVDGMEAFGKQVKGFNRPDAVLLGVESRTSSPIRITRDETLQSSVRGLYPCGEGAGYAGGITSAAMDGLRVAEAIVKADM